MPRSKIEPVVRVIVVFSILLSSLSSAIVSASPARSPNYQGDEPTATPVATATATTAAAPATTEPATETATPAATATLEATATATPTIPSSPPMTATPVTTPTLTATPTITPTPTATTTLEATATVTPTVPPALTVTATPITTPTLTATPTLSPTSTVTPTSTPSLTPTPVPSTTVTITPTLTPAPGPQANFSAAPLSGRAPLVVNFVNSSANAGRYGWDFGDSTSGSTKPNPTHTYSQAGVYTVTLAAGDGVITDTLVKPGYITVSMPVEANFSAFPLSGPAPLSVLFFNSSTGASHHRWAFGDGSSGSTDLHPTHTYSQAGVYAVTLAAGDGVITDTLVKPGYITVSVPVEANFSAFPLSGSAPLPVLFFNNSTGASHHRWAFGDGSSGSTDLHPTHTYTQAGVYTVTLAAGDGTVTDTWVSPNYITVSEPMIAAFSAFPRIGPAPLTVLFFDNSTNASGYLWDFGDGLTSTLPSPTHTAATGTG